MPFERIQQAWGRPPNERFHSRCSRSDAAYLAEEQWRAICPMAGYSFVAGPPMLRGLQQEIGRREKLYWYDSVASQGVNL